MEYVNLHACASSSVFATLHLSDDACMLSRIIPSFEKWGGYHSMLVSSNSMFVLGHLRRGKVAKGELSVSKLGVVRGCKILQTALHGRALADYGARD
eukprot:4866130-Pleurochrysis_carterae.AAC.1